MLKTPYMIGAGALAVAAGLVALQACAQNTAVPPPPGGAPTFDAVDTNHDGTISKTEFQAFVAHAPVGGPHGPGGPGRHFVRQMMPMDIKTLDTDGDGKISLEEFATPMKAHFAELDTNHDGFLDANELPPPHDGLPPPPSLPGE
jgi:hypothetical protein